LDVVSAGPSADALDRGSAPLTPREGEWVQLTVQSSSTGREWVVGVSICSRPNTKGDALKMPKLLRSVRVAAVIAALPLVFAPAAAAQSATTELARITEYYDYVAGADPCLGESIHVQGEITYVLRETVTGSGNVLTAGHTIADMTAVGVTTGTEYTLVDSRQITTNFTATGEGISGAGAWTYALVGRGPGPNLIITNQYKVTITPDGRVAVSFYNVDVRCVG
jgi:hypothetical protein